MAFDLFSSSVTCFASISRNQTKKFELKSSNFDAIILKEGGRRKPNGLQICMASKWLSNDKNRENGHGNVNKAAIGEGVETMIHYGNSQPTQNAPMEVQRVLHMNGGEGDTSYSNNSLLQKNGLLNVKPILEESIKTLYCSMMPQCLKIADMGCSSGPNAYAPLWDIINTVDSMCTKLNHKSPVFQFFLNDLPGNDFNNIFKLNLGFQETLKKEKGTDFGPCFIAAMPGSFYSRLFPDNSIHLFHSSYSINWLSKVPLGLANGIGRMNRGNICTAKTSPPIVWQAYFDQFGRDFTTFLKSRSKEIVPGGRMVLTMMGNNADNIWELLGITLNDMVKEGLVEESMLDSFNIPIYFPCGEEIKNVVQREGSFKLLKLETFRLNWDGEILDSDSDSEESLSEKRERGKRMALTLRAAGESIIANHFGDEITDTLFNRHAIKAADYMEKTDGVWTNHVLSLVKE